VMNAVSNRIQSTVSYSMIAAHSDHFAPQPQCEFHQQSQTH